MRPERRPARSPRRRAPRRLARRQRAAVRRPPRSIRRPSSSPAPWPPPRTSWPTSTPPRQSPRSDKRRHGGNPAPCCTVCGPWTSVALPSRPLWPPPPRASPGAAGVVGADQEMRFPIVEDPPITVFVVFSDGVRHQPIVEALGMEQPNDGRLSPAARAQRDAMKALVALLTEPRASLAASVVGDDTPSEPTAMRL